MHCCAQRGDGGWGGNCSASVRPTKITKIKRRIDWTGIRLVRITMAWTRQFVLLCVVRVSCKLLLREFFCCFSGSLLCRSVVHPRCSLVASCLARLLPSLAAPLTRLCHRTRLLLSGLPFLSFPLSPSNAMHCHAMQCNVRSEASQPSPRYIRPGSDGAGWTETMEHDAGTPVRRTRQQLRAGDNGSATPHASSAIRRVLAVHEPAVLYGASTLMVHPDLRSR